MMGQPMTDATEATRYVLEYPANRGMQKEGRPGYGPYNQPLMFHSLKDVPCRSRGAGQEIPAVRANGI